MMANKRRLSEIQLLMTDLDVKSYFQYESSGFINDKENGPFFIYGYILPRSFPYNYGSFKIQIKLPPEYPFKVPELSFLTHIYHRSIHVCGGDLTPFCCHDCLNHIPTTRLYQIIKQAVEIIDDPNCTIRYRGRNLKSEEQYERNKNEYWYTVMNNIEKYAYPRKIESTSSLKFITKRIIRKQLQYDSSKINQLLIPKSLQDYLHIPFDKP